MPKTMVGRLPRQAEEPIFWERCGVLKVTVTAAGSAFIRHRAAPEDHARRIRRAVRGLWNAAVFAHIRRATFDPLHKLRRNVLGIHAPLRLAPRRTRSFMLASMSVSTTRASASRRSLRQFAIAILTVEKLLQTIVKDWT
jgi:hypothetical protein